MYEHHNVPLLPVRLFWRRMLRHGGAAFGIIAVSLGVGTVGYHVVGGLTWLDAFENASMILGGMGPVYPITAPSGKVFVSLYALYSGLIVLVIAGIIFTPVFHRLMHHFHLEHRESAK